MEAVFKLRCPDGPPELRGSYAFKLADLRRIEAALTDMLPDLCKKWSEIHGD